MAPSNVNGSLQGLFSTTLVHEHPHALLLTEAKLGRTPCLGRHSGLIQHILFQRYWSRARKVGRKGKKEGVFFYPLICLFSKLKVIPDVIIWIYIG